jgi:hypothetical protein
MGVEWIEHRGVRILTVDYSDSKGQEVAVIEKVGRELAAAPFGTGVVFDLSTGAFGPEFMGKAKQLNSQVFGPRKAQFAVIGVNGLMSILIKGFNAVSSGIRAEAFPSRAAALDHLASASVAS